MPLAGSDHAPWKGILLMALADVALVVLGWKLGGIERVVIWSAVAIWSLPWVISHTRQKLKNTVLQVLTVFFGIILAVTLFIIALSKLYTKS